MNELIEILYLRDLALGYMPEGDIHRVKEAVQNRQDGMTALEAFIHCEFKRAADGGGLISSDAFTSVEVAANDLLLTTFMTIFTHFQFDGKFSERGKRILKRKGGWGVVMGRLIAQAQTLADVAAFELPEWIVNKYKTNAQRLGQEPKQVRSNPVRDVMLDVMEGKPDISSAEMWSVLKEMAENLEWPFICVDGGEIKYLDGERVKFLKRRGVAERLKRIKDTR